MVALTWRNIFLRDPPKQGSPQDIHQFTPPAGILKINNARSSPRHALYSPDISVDPILRDRQSLTPLTPSPPGGVAKGEANLGSQRKCPRVAVHACTHGNGAPPVLMHDVDILRPRRRVHLILASVQISWNHACRRHHRWGGVGRSFGVAGNSQGVLSSRGGSGRRAEEGKQGGEIRGGTARHRSCGGRRKRRNGGR